MCTAAVNIHDYFGRHGKGLEGLQNGMEWTNFEYIEFVGGAITEQTLQTSQALQGEAKERQGASNEKQWKAKEKQWAAKEMQGKSKEKQGKAKEKQGKPKEKQSKANEYVTQENKGNARAIKG